MTPRADEIAQEIDSEYVVTYIPKRPLAGPPWKSISESMSAGIIGLHVQARFGYVAGAQ